MHHQSDHPTKNKSIGKFISKNINEFNLQLSKDH